MSCMWRPRGHFTTSWQGLGVLGAELESTMHGASVLPLLRVLFVPAPGFWGLTTLKFLFLACVTFPFISDGFEGLPTALVPALCVGPQSTELG